MTTGEANESLTRDYSEAGFARLLGAGKHPALLIVDAVQAYTSPDSPLYAAAEDAVAGMAETLTLARERNLPVVHTRVVYRRGGHDGGVFRRKVASLDSFEEDNQFGESAAGLEPQEHETVIEKAYASAFFGTALAAHLTHCHVDTLIVCGFTTSGCVRATAVDACQSGFVTVVVPEACGDRAVAPHEANLFDLGAKYADVVALASLPAYLDRAEA